MSRGESCFHLRPWLSVDLDHCHRIAIEASGPKAWTLKAYSDSFAVGDIGYVCEQSEAIGCLVGRVLFDQAEILDLQVLPGYQGTTAARQLLKAFCDHCRAKQAVQILLEVRASNDRAIAFYHKHHFHEIDRRQLYYPTRESLPAEDALVLRLSIDEIASL